MSKSTSFTASEHEAFRQLAEACLVSRLSRAVCTGHTSKGRVKCTLSAEGQTEAETAWFSLRTKLSTR